MPCYRIRCTRKGYSSIFLDKTKPKPVLLIVQQYQLTVGTGGSLQTQQQLCRCSQCLTAARVCLVRRKMWLKFQPGRDTKYPALLWHCPRQTSRSPPAQQTFLTHKVLLTAPAAVQAASLGVAARVEGKELTPKGIPTGKADPIAASTSAEEGGRTGETIGAAADEVNPRPRRRTPMVRVRELTAFIVAVWIA